MSRQRVRTLSCLAVGGGTFQDNSAVSGCSGNPITPNFRWAQTQDHSVKPASEPAAIVHVTFVCVCLTNQKLAFWIHMDITDQYRSKHGDAGDFRSGVTHPGTQRELRLL
jgi:hypothetical protein